MSSLTKYLPLLFLQGLIALGHALVVDDQNSHSTPPANGAPWFNVGSGNGASCVYLNKGWVVGARHVFGGTTSPVVTFGGMQYSGGTIFVLTNPDSSPSDVVLFNIGGVPASSTPIGIVTSTPNSQLTMIGFGSRRNGALTTINYTGGTANGYLWEGTNGTKSWGTNQRSSQVFTVAPQGFNAIAAYTTTFTANGFSGTAQASVGDSGGALFTKISGNWLLAGTMHFIAGFSGQQGNTSANGNLTYCADTFSYASQINARLDSVALAPVIDAVSTSNLVANTSETITVFGSNFVNGAKVQVSSAGAPLSFSDTPVAAAFVDSNTLTVSLNLSPAGTRKLRVVNPDGQPSAAINLTIQPANTYSTWLQNYPSLTGNNALMSSDPDADGLSNLEEYAFESNPTDPADSNRPVTAIVFALGSQYLTLTYEKDRAKSDLLYQAQVSTDLTELWTDIPDTLVDETGTVQHRRASILIEGEAKFLRIRVTK